MNDRSEKPPVTPDDLATSALDAHGADEARAIAAHVQSSPDDALRFTDLGTAWEVDLGVAGGIRPAGPGEVDAEIVTAAVDFCRGVGARLGPRGLAYDAAGDERLAGTVVDALPALAVL